MSPPTERYGASIFRSDLPLESRQWYRKYLGNIPGGLKQFSCGSASKFWGVNKDDQIYQWTGNGWKNIPGGLKHVSAAADGSVWGVNSNDQIYYMSNGSWKMSDGLLKQISVGNYKNVAGCNVNDNVYVKTTTVQRHMSNQYPENAAPAPTPAPQPTTRPGPKPRSFSTRYSCPAQPPQAVRP